MTERSAPNAHRLRLGEQLLSEGAIVEEVLKQALQQQQHTGGRLGDILIRKGALSLPQVYTALARQWQRSHVCLRSERPDPALLEVGKLSAYVRLGVIPWRRDEQGRLILASCHPGDHEDSLARHFTDEPYRWVVTSPHDIAWALQDCFGEMLLTEASETLARQAPHYALRGRSRGTVSRMVSGAMCCAAVAGSIYYPAVMARFGFWLISLLFLLTLAFKLFLTTVGFTLRRRWRDCCDVPLLSDDALPTYTVLVPLYKEAESVPGLLASLDAMDYPADKLDIKLLVEAGDGATRSAILAVNPDHRVHLVVVPPSTPQTKPKACNYGLAFATGRYITIFDAEDCPEPGQLRRAASLFHHYPQVSCLQARLNYYNADESWLTRLFSLEYTLLFDYMLPALCRLQIPIPLGGTSNHLRREALESLGRWDAYNVTEDADLGIRLASEGYVTLPFDALTLEEAPVDALGWIKQRTRWIKGYLQTWQVLLRRPLRCYQRFGHRGFWGVHFFIGASSLVYILSPLLWGMALVWWLWPDIMSEPLPALEKGVALSVLVAGLLIQWGCAFLAGRKGRFTVMFTTILLYPLYFILHSIAGWRALWQWCLNPHYWEKTRHGVSKYTSFRLDKKRGAR